MTLLVVGKASTALKTTLTFENITYVREIKLQVQHEP